MSRLTGADALGLYGAYQAVYNPQELTEEQVWEEVETWVNSLIEEGYDLSDYTWEEMYESYLEEAGMDVFKAIRDANSKPSPVFTQPIKKAPPLGQPGSGFQDRRPVLGMPSNNSLTLPPNRVGPGLVGGKVGPKIVGPKIVGPKIVGPKIVGPGKAPPTADTSPVKSAPTARLTATAAAPKPAAATTPAPAKPAPGTKDAGPESIRPKTPNPLMQKTFGYQTGNSPRDQQSRADKIVQSGAVKALAPKPSTPTPAASPVNRATGSKKPGSIVSGFDMFDVVKGYLIGEGYADTEEAALAIMTNMSEEWRQSIVEKRAPGVSEYKPNRLNPLPSAKPLSGKKGDGSGYGADEKFKKPDDKITKPGTEVPAPKEGGYGRIFSNIPYGIGAHANRQRSRNSTIRGMDPGAPRSEKLAPPEKKEKKKPSREIVRKRKDTNESYDIILSYLLDEGYANTVESAEAIISNMSEDWILSIIQ